MAGYAGGHPEECGRCGAPPWESCGKGPLDWSACERTLQAKEPPPQAKPAPEADYGAPGGWIEHPTPRPEHDPRAAGQVQRYHTWQQIRPQSVGEHTHQLTRIVLTIAPDCRKEVLVWVLSHDLGERRTGDLPYPIKKNMGNGRSVIDAIEAEAVAEMVSFWMLPRPPCIAPAEKALVKHCEYIEMCEWALCELELGNRHAHIVYERCLEQMKLTAHDLDKDAVLRSDQYWRKRWRQHRGTMGEVL